MGKTKEILITGFALFSMFFGAGNLVLPPYIGFKAGDAWFLVLLGFLITAVVFPILGIFAHAKLQGTMFDFGKKISPLFSYFYCFSVYLIAILLPVPRTASVTHEMAVQPFFNSGSLVTSTIYFILVFVFVMNRKKAIDLLGRFLTPLIVLILLAIICVGVFIAPIEMNSTTFSAPFVSGILEGYQTFDAMGSVVVGGVLVISIKQKGNYSFEVNKALIKKAGIVAGLGLLFIYGGLLFNGAIFSSTFNPEATRAQLLTELSLKTLGNVGSVLLSVLVALACFTTAVGIVIGTADFFKEYFNNSKKVYLIVAILSCILGVLIGQLNVHYIINIALPALMFIYPITIVLILLNLVSNKYASNFVFKWVVSIAFIFSIPDFLSFIIPEEGLNIMRAYIPWSNYNLGWLLPSVITFVLVNLFKK